ncbi:MAG: AAA family ATPase [Lachnospiraceae bacterium]|nr:AAA family ATPase [Lachnospiraceae bacterium]
MGKLDGENEKRFRDWLKSQAREDGMRTYSDNEISAYAYALRVGATKVENNAMANLFYCSDAKGFNETCEQLMRHPDFASVNEEGHGVLEVSMHLYKLLLERGERFADPQEHAAYYMRSGGEVSTAAPDSRGQDFYFTEENMRPIQRVYYGAPGTGKSHSVNELLKAEYPDEKVRDAHIKRAIFHPAYTYGDFVGCIKPMVSADSPLDYSFVAGPFTALLKAAFLHPSEKYYLIVEEINRGNAPSIFGDVFQLLDRGESGRSEYPIINRDIGAYFCLDPWMKNIFTDGKIWLPPNFNILATMNTADENIFVMDSAFKRRFELYYVPIDFSVLPDSMKAERSIFAGSRPLEEVLSGTTGRVGELVKKLQAKGELKRNWPTFAAIVNTAIDEENCAARAKGITKDKRIAENKKLGPFFVHQEELMDKKLFLNKVIFYLKQDVFTESNHYFLDAFESIMDDYAGQEDDLFELLA